MELSINDFEIDNRDDCTTELVKDGLKIIVTREDLEMLLENMDANSLREALLG